MTNRMKNNTMKKIVAMMFAAMMIFSLAVSLAEADIWTCARCGKESRGNFCAWCGSSRPEEQAHCSVCGTEYDPEAGYAFCFNCGSSLHPDAVRTGMVRPACRVSTEFFGNGSALEGTWSLVDDPDTYYGMDFETTLEKGGSVTMTFDGSTMTLAASYNGEVYAQSFSYSTYGDMIILETGSCTYRISEDTLTLFFNGTSDDPYVMKKVY